MQQSTLQEILGVEKEIREQLDAERERASRWLEDARRQVQAEHEAGVARLQAGAGQREAAARQAARQKAEEVLGQAQAAANAVAHLTDDELRRALVRHIVCIVPGASNAG
jgi:vacuolar-type H+-ATPase subunit H